MQLAVRPGTVNRFLAAGVAVTGAGLIAGNPALPVLPDIQQRALQLTSNGAALADDSAGAWSQLFETTNNNLAALGDELSANPSPILSELSNNLSDYGELLVGTEVPAHYGGTMTTGIEGVIQGLQEVLVEGNSRIDALIPTLESVMTDIGQGDFLDAFSTLDVYFLIGLEAIAKPLFPLLDVPGEMAQNFTDVIDVVTDVGNVFATAKALLSPVLSSLFQLSTSLGSVDGVQDIFDIPAEVIDAFFNGWTYPGQEESFPGLLTDGGTLDYLLVTLPNKIADALNPGLSDLTSNLSGSLDFGGEEFNAYDVASVLADSGIDFDGDVDQSAVVEALEASDLEFNAIDPDDVGVTDIETALSEDDVVGSEGDNFDVDALADALADIDFSDGDVTASDVTDAVSGQFDFADVSFGADAVAEALNDSAIGGLTPEDIADVFTDATGAEEAGSAAVSEGGGLFGDLFAGLF